MNVSQVLIGFDPAESVAYDVAESSLRSHSKLIKVAPVKLESLRQLNLYRRPTQFRAGHLWDTISDAPMSTEFAISRFFVPWLSDGADWVLFVDSDVVFLRPVEELFALADSRKAIMCVKHRPLLGSEPKKCGRPQKPYPYKNWSSVMLWNVKHPQHQALTIDLLNSLPGRDLHAFCWLSADQIGTLPEAWNWLVGVNPKPENPGIAHFTLGGPWLSGWKPQPHDEIWLKEYNRS